MSERTRQQLTYDLSPETPVCPIAAATGSIALDRPISPLPPEESADPGSAASGPAGLVTDHSPCSDDTDMCLISPGELYTHPEVDEEDDDSSSKASADRPVSAIDIKMKNRLSGSFAESGSTSSSLQEFERLESEILRSASHSGTPQKTPQKMPGNGTDRPDDSDPASLSPAQEKINILIAQSTLSEIDEGHESQASDSGETVTGGDEDSDSEAIDKQLTEIEELTSRHYRRKELQDTRHESSDESSSPAIRPQQIDLSKRTSFDRCGKQRSGSAVQPAETRTERKSHDDAVADKEDEEEGEREDEFDEESYRREESYRISHCMLASADSVELDLMTASFRSEATMISSSEGFDYVLTSEPRLAFAGSSVTQTSRYLESEEHVTTDSGPETSHSYSSKTATQSSTSTVHHVSSDEES